MFWSIGQFPELDHLEPDERRRLLRRVPWWTYPQIILVALVTGGATAALPAAFAYESSGAAPAGAAAFGVIVALVAAVVYLLLLRRVRVEMRKEIAAGFLGRRPPFCFECGYDLRGFFDERCPECGREVVGGAAPNRDTRDA